MSEQKNQLRLSVDVRSLKEHQFTAQLYLAYKSLPELGIKNFRSSPSLAITNPRVQVQLNNCFRSYLFEANRTQLKEKMNNSISFQLWHNDRIKKDILLGVAKLPLSSILQQPFRKTKQSYAVQYDVLLPIDEVDEQMNPLKKIGTLRAVVYLEDLGPVSKLKQKGFDIKNFIDEDVPYEQNNEERILQNDLPQLSGQKFASLSENKRLQLNDLEQKVVWQLEVWKKNEQARTRIVLKQKQAQFWANLSQQQKKSDIEKQKQFKKIQANLGLLQNKMKAKMNDLIKREQKIVVYEQQLQSKISEVSREVFLKDEEIERMKRRFKEEKTGMIKEKSNLELQVSKLKADNARLKVQLEEARKEDEKAPINIVKNELNHKIMQIKELRKQLQNCMQIKEQFKIHYERMKSEVIDKKSALQTRERELISMEKDNQILRHSIRQLEQQVTFLRQQQQYNQQNNNMNHDGDSSDEEPEYNSERQRLIKKRRELLERGNYPPNDPLIQQYDRKIAQLSH